MEMVVGVIFFALLVAIIVKVNGSSGRKRGRSRYNSDSTDSYSAPIFFAGSSDSSGDCGSSFGGDGGSCGGGGGD
ncbi:hypothetical protein ACEOWG_001929 [Bacillus cereus]|uniref:hypothetical protein n=1 Tax=Bacillus sp. 123MFChir2 TaxID=1169144 RepID=UPI00037FD232|nr:hypothetical protein [Bacillus sp. 123MFChir2]